MAIGRRQTTVWPHEEENIFQAALFKDANFWIGLRAAQNCFCFPSPTSNNATSGAARSVGPFRAPLDLSSLQEPRGAARTRCPAQLGFRRRCRRAPRQENVACCCIHRSTIYCICTLFTFVWVFSKKSTYPGKRPGDGPIPGSSWILVRSEKFKIFPLTYGKPIAGGSAPWNHGTGDPHTDRGAAGEHCANMWGKEGFRWSDFPCDIAVRVKSVKRFAPVNRVTYLQTDNTYSFRPLCERVEEIESTTTTRTTSSPATGFAFCLENENVGVPFQ